MAFHVGEDDMGKFPVVVGFICSAGVGLLSWLCLSQQYGVLVYSYSQSLRASSPRVFIPLRPTGTTPFGSPVIGGQKSYLRGGVPAACFPPDGTAPLR